MNVNLQRIEFGIEMSQRQFAKLLKLEKEYDEDMYTAGILCTNLPQTWFVDTSVVSTEWCGHFGAQMIIQLRPESVEEGLRDIETCRKILQEKLK